MPNVLSYNPDLYLTANSAAFQDTSIQLVASDLSWLDGFDFDPGTNDFAVSFWIMLNPATDSGSYHTVVMTGAMTGHAGFSITLLKSTGAVGLWFKAGGATRVYDTSMSAAIGTGVWTHVLAYFDRDGSATVYLNGAVQDSIDISDTDGTSVGVTEDYLGAFNTTPTHLVDGRLDSFMVFSKADLSTDIADILAWTYNSGSGNTGSDISTANKTLWGGEHCYDFSGEQAAGWLDSWGTSHLTFQSKPKITPPTYGSEELTDGSFDTWTTPTDLADWAEANLGTGGVIEEETTIVHTAGGSAVKITTGDLFAIRVQQGLTFTPGATYRVSFWTRSDGVGPGFYAIYSNAELYYIPRTSTGVTGTEWQKVVFEWTMAAGDTGLVYVMLWGGENDGEVVYYDDVSVKQVVSEGLLNGGFDQWTNVAGTQLVANPGLETRAGRQWAQFTAADKSHLSVASHADLNLGTGDIFLTASVRRDSIGSYQVIASKYENSADYWRLAIDSTNYVHFRCRASATTEIEIECNTTALSSTSTDYHIAVLVDRSNSANTKVYVNGVSQSFATNSVSANSVDNTGALLLGVWDANNTSPFYFDGRISQVGIGKPADASAAAVQLAAGTTNYNGGVGQYYSEIAAADRTTLGLTAYWNFLETTGDRTDSIGANDLSEVFGEIIKPATFGSELLLNGDLDTWSTPTDLTSWSDAPGAGSIDEETVIVHTAGGSALKMTGGATLNTYSHQHVAVTAGRTYRYSFWTRGDGVNSAKFAVYDDDNTSYISAALEPTSVTGTEWQLIVYDFVAPVGCTSVDLYLRISNVYGAQVYFDDVSLKEITDPGLLNGGFENWTVPTATQLVTNAGCELRTGRGWAQFTASDKSHLTVASHADLNLGTGDIFLTASVYRDSVGTSQVIASKYQDNSNYWLLQFISSDRIRFLAYAAGAKEIEIIGTETFSSTSTAYHIAVLIDRDNSANTKVYVNGVTLTNSTNTVSATDIDNTGDLLVGQYGSDLLYWDGRISQVGIGKPTDASAASVQYAASTVNYNSGLGQYYEEIDAGDAATLALKAYWDLREATGARADAIGSNDFTEVFSEIIKPATYGAELLTDGDFETAGAGGADIWTNWSEAVSDGALANETATVHSGSDACKITAGASLDTLVQSAAVAITAGRTYRLSLWTRGDGVAAGQVRLWADSSGNYLVPTSTGINGTEWALYTFDFTAVATENAYVILYAGPTSGDVAYYDDVSFKEITDPGLLNGGFENWTVPAPTQLVTNPGGELGTADWNTNGVSLASVIGGVEGNCLELTNTGAAVGYCYQAVTTVSGATYRVSWKQKNGTAGAKFRVGTSPGGSNLLFPADQSNAAWAAYSGIFNATSTTTYISAFVATAGAGDSTLFDQIELVRIPSNADSWEEAGIAQSSATREDEEVYSGSHALVLTIDSVASTTYAKQVALTADKSYTYSFYGKVSDASGGDHIYNPVSTTAGSYLTLTAAWAEYTGTVDAFSTYLSFSRYNAAGKSVYIDNATVSAAEIQGVDDPSYWTSGWTAGSSILTHVSGGVEGGCLQVENGAAAYCKATQNVTVVVNDVYRLTFWHKNGSHSGTVTVGSTSSGDEYLLSATYNDVTWTKRELTFLATTTTVFLRLFVNHNDIGDTTLFDQVELVRVPYDPGNWAEVASGSSFFNREDEDVDAGTHSLCMSVRSAAIRMYQHVQTVGKLYSYSIRSKSVNGSAYLSYTEGAPSIGSAATWETYAGSGRALNSAFEIRRSADAVYDVLVDEVTFAAAEIQRVSDATIWSNWSNVSTTDGVAIETDVVHSKAIAARLTNSGSYVYSSSIPVVAGEVYRITLWSRGNGSTGGSWALYDVTHAAWIVAFGTSTGVAAATYTKVTREFIAPSGCVNVRIYCIAASSGDVYFDDIEMVQLTNNPDDWTEFEAGTSFLHREDSDVDAGDHSLRLSVDASSSETGIQQTSVLTPGKLYHYSVRAKGVSGTPLFRVVLGSSNYHTLDTTWTEYSNYSRALADNRLYVINSTAPSNQILLDDLNLTAVTHEITAGIAKGTATDYNTGVDFDGSSSLIYTLSARINVHLNDMTLGLAFRANNAQNSVLYSFDTADGAIFLELETDGRLRFYVGSVTATSSWSPAGSVVPGQWHTLIVRYDRSGQLSYSLDGATFVDVLLISANVAADWTGGELYIGRYHTSSLYFDGTIDNFFHANRLFTQTEADYLYNEGDWRQYAELGEADTDGETIVSWYSDEAWTNLFVNGDFETLGAGDPDFWSTWSETPVDGAIADETTLVHSGSHAAKITRGATLGDGGARMQGALALKAGTYRLSVWTRGDGTNAGRVRVWGTVSNDIQAQTSTGITGTDYALYTTDVTVADESVFVILYAGNVEGAVAYFDDVTLSQRQGIMLFLEGDYAHDLSLDSTGSGTHALASNVSSGLGVTSTDFDLGTGDFAIGFSCVPTSSVDATILSMGVTGDAEQFVVLRRASEKLVIELNDASGAYYTATTTASLLEDAWSDVLVTFDRDGTVKCSINGVKQTLASMAAKSGAINPGMLYIGTQAAGAAPRWAGLLGNVYIMNRLPSAAEQAWLLNAGAPHAHTDLADDDNPSLLETDFTAWFLFNLSANLGYNQIADSADLAVVGTPARTRTGPGHLPMLTLGTLTQVPGINYYEGQVACWGDRSANINNAEALLLDQRPGYATLGADYPTVLFDGVDDFFDVNEIAYTGEFSLAFLVEFEDTVANEVVVGNSSGNHVQMTDSTTIAVTTGSGSGTVTVEDLSDGLNTVVVTRDADNLVKVYVNGEEQIDTATIAGTLTWDMIGSDGTNFLQGKLAAITAYNFELSDEQRVWVEYSLASGAGSPSAPSSPSDGWCMVRDLPRIVPKILPRIPASCD